MSPYVIWYTGLPLNVERVYLGLGHVLLPILSTRKMLLPIGYLVDGLD